jgi:hypothetical protein
MLEGKMGNDWGSGGWKEDTCEAALDVLFHSASGVLLARLA